MAEAAEDWKYMDERERDILMNLRLMADRFDSVEQSVKNNDWNTVSSWLTQAEEMGKSIKNHPLTVETLLARNPVFAEQYEPLKQYLIGKIESASSAIALWRDNMGEQISNAKNVIDNISRFYSPPSSSYYIDRKE